MKFNVNITATSHDVFMMYAEDAGNWGGVPMVGANVGGTKEERGNLTNLKKAGLIETFTDDDGPETCIWIEFTEAGLAYSLEHGIEIETDR